MFIPIWGNDPIWLIFFRWVEITNQPCFQPFSWNVIQGGTRWCFQGFWQNLPQAREGDQILTNKNTNYHEPPKPMKNKGLGHLKTKWFSTETSKFRFWRPMVEGEESTTVADDGWMTSFLQWMLGYKWNSPYPLFGSSWVCWEKLPVDVQNLLCLFIMF